MQGDVHRIYIQTPDRLASGAKLVLLVEEFQEHGVEVVFLKGSMEDTPEGKFLLHMQGAMAEYERTKIVERTRRGKLYWARQGAMVGVHSPYGYRFVRRTDTSRAHIEIDEGKAPVVRKVFRLLVEEGMSTRGIAVHLIQQGIATAKGAVQWQPTAIDRILRNSAYKGEFRYHKTRRVTPERPRLDDPYRSNRKSSYRSRPEEEHITIPVPAIVDQETWESAQKQLSVNSLRSRRNNTKHQYLLRGLIKCPRCGSTYIGQAKSGRRTYRCGRTDWALSSKGIRCSPGSFSADIVEDLVWEAVTDALKRPDLIINEYTRRIEQSGAVDATEYERKQLKPAMARLKTQEDRITEAYVNEAMDLERYKDEMYGLRIRKQEHLAVAQLLEQRYEQHKQSERALEHLDTFCNLVTEGIVSTGYEDKQRLMQLLVEQVIVRDGIAHIETVIPTSPPQGSLRTRHPERSEESGMGYHSRLVVA